MSDSVLRDAIDADTPAILALNLESEAMLSPMDAGRYAALRAEAAYARVLEEDGEVVAFLLAFRERAAYDSPNYRWFDARYDRFLYVDRVVVAASHHGRKLGRRLYDDLFAFARTTDAPCVTCEFDIEPLNLASQRFHASFGFEEVGVQRLPGKVVSLQRASV